MRKLSNIMPFFVCAVLLVLFLCLGLLGMAYMFPVESDGGRHANVYDLKSGEDERTTITLDGTEHIIGNPSVLEDSCPDWKEIDFFWQPPAIS